MAGERGKDPEIADEDAPSWRYAGTGSCSRTWTRSATMSRVRERHPRGLDRLSLNHNRPRDFSTAPEAQRECALNLHGQKGCTVKSGPLFDLIFAARTGVLVPVIGPEGRFRAAAAGAGSTRPGVGDYSAFCQPCTSRRARKCATGWPNRSASLSGSSRGIRLTREFQLVFDDVRLIAGVAYWRMWTIAPPTFRSSSSNGWPSVSCREPVVHRGRRATRRRRLANR